MQLDSDTNDSCLFGLHALSELDVAVNGKNNQTNSMRGYSRQPTAEVGTVSLKKTPPKPPRIKALSPFSSSSRFLQNDNRILHSASDGGGTASSSSASKSDHLRSPTEVLYAISDKFKINDVEDNGVEAYMQKQSPYFCDTNRKVQHDDNSRFKAQIQILSPSFDTALSNRKSYKTTINTATDNIQYRNYDSGGRKFQKNIFHRPKSTLVETDHYKVPRSLANHQNGSRLKEPLWENSRNFGTRVGEIDREGRSLHQGVAERLRHLSGYSTSPEREYSTSNGVYRNNSPTRPPRSKSNPAYNATLRRSTSRRNNEIRASTSNLLNEQYNSSRSTDEDRRLSRFTEYRGESVERERGRSLPPTAHNNSLGNSSQMYQSMYTLPPNPSRPAPILTGGGRHLGSTRRSVGRASISEGDVTDDASFVHGVLHHNNQRNDAKRRPSLKRQAPIPPRKPVQNFDRSGMNVWTTRGRQTAPPGRTSMGGRPRASLDSSYSESECVVDDDDEEEGEYDEDESIIRDDSISGFSSAKFGPRSTMSAPSLVQQQRRLRSSNGISGIPNLYQNQVGKDMKIGGVSRRLNGLNNSDIDSDYRREMVINGSGYRGDGDISASSSMGHRGRNIREEERRKVIQIEGERAQQNMPRRSTAGIYRSGSKAALQPRHNLASDDQDDSQYSGPVYQAAKHRLNRVGNRRNNARGMRTIGRPGGSATSSINSSESEQPPPSHENSQRNVFLHTTAVVDIPSHQSGNFNLATTNLQKSKKISRSISLLAPWKSRGGSQPPQPLEIHYDNDARKPPRPPASVIRRSNDDLGGKHRILLSAMSRDVKSRSASASNLGKDDRPLAATASTTMTTRGRQKGVKVSRSVSMPKDAKLTGWFRKRKRF